MRTGKKKVDIKYSFTNANFDQYTPEALAYMQSQRYFVERCIKESKYILGIDQFQTRKWLVSSFVLKEKLLNFETAPLLSARDIKEMLVFKLYKQMTEEQMQDRIFNRHLLRQQDT